MDITLQQVADVLNKTPDEVLFMVQDGRLASVPTQDDEIQYLADGRVEFTTGNGTVEWRFKFEDVLAAKKELEEGMDGQLQQLLQE